MARKKANDQTATAATQGGARPQAAASAVANPAGAQVSAPTQADPAAGNGAAEVLMPEPVLRITAKPKHGFRRCGAHHPAQATDHPAGRFSEAQIIVLKAEPNLIVEDL